MCWYVDVVKQYMRLIRGIIILMLRPFIMTLIMFVNLKEEENWKSSRLISHRS